MFIVASITANDSITSITSASNTPSQQQQQQNHSSNNFSVQNHSINNNQGGHHNQQNSQQSLNSGNSSTTDRNSNNSTTWSSVTTGGTQPQEGQPPLYQSPQFQHEFPSLDGTTPSGLKANHQAQTNAINVSGGNNVQNNQQTSGNHSSSAQYDGPQMSLRPQTEPSTWMQQNMSGKSVEGVNQQHLQQAPALHVPPQLKALMPSFMYRSGGVGGGSGNFSSPTSSNTGIGFGLPLSQQPNHQSGGGGNNQNQNNYQNRNRNFGNSGNNNNDHPSYQGRRSGNVPPRLQNQQQQNRQNQYDDYSGRGLPQPLIEPEAIIHRPIIRDEELERIENIAKDDGWAKDDTIDYNQKLNFSDDEVDPPPSVSMVVRDQRTSVKHEKEDVKNISEDEKRLCKYFIVHDYFAIQKYIHKKKELEKYLFLKLFSFFFCL